VAKRFEQAAQQLVEDEYLLAEDLGLLVNTGRHQIGMVGDIIADSRATSPGIRTSARTSPRL
jgi:hypothetical protein